MSGARVLVVDDDPSVLKSLRRGLEGVGFEVSVLAAAAEVLATVAKWRPDVVLLDLVLPDGDGVQVAGAIRDSWSTPIIVLSAVGDDARKVDALNAGADDYVVKPFSMVELQARIRAAIRRSAGNASTSLVVGPLELDLLKRKLQIGGVEVRLTRTEYELMRLFMAQPGRVFTQRHLLASVWGPEFVDDTHILRTFVHQLRSKLSTAEPGSAAMLVNDPGVGYRLTPPAP